MFIAAVLALSAFSKPTLHLRLVYFSVSSFAFVKFGADTIFYFAVRDIAAILGFIFDLVFRAEMLFLSYLTARCFAIILIKFANSPRTPCTVELHSVSNLASNLTRKLAAQRLAARQIYSNIKNGASSTFLIILNGESSASCRICVEYCGFCRVPRTLMTVERVRSLPSTI